MKPTGKVGMEPGTQVQIRPTVQGTFAILGACVISYGLSFAEAQPSQVARMVSIAWLLGIVTSFLFDLRLGLRNMIRVDVFALCALYFFIYFEFLFPQSRFDVLVNPDDVVTAIHLTLFGLGTIVIGRHIEPGSEKSLGFIGKIEMRRGDFLLIFFGAFIVAHLPQWLAVGFNPVQWVEELTGPRFTQSWGRGRYGDLSALLHELQLIGYIVPPIAGVILARSKEYAKFTVFVVAVCLLILWFVAFCGGTRNILGIQMAGFLGGYLIVQKQLRFRRLAILSGVIAMGFLVMANMMLDFRQIGLERYIEEERYKPAFQKFEDEYGELYGEEDSGYFVDYNLWRLSQMVGAFPDLYDFIGWNMPYVALTKPIPRALWSGKPTDLKIGLEEVIGAEGYTIAVTWIGEAYIAGGIVWIIPIGLLIGMFCRYWNHLAGYIGRPFPLIVFASGFYAVLLLMRSLMFFTTALLPSIALVVMGAVIYKNRQNPG